MRHVVQCAFDGRRIVIFSGGEKVADDAAFLKDIQAIHDGGGFGSIIGRNSFQRPREEALKLLGAVMDCLRQGLIGSAFPSPTRC